MLSGHKVIRSTVPRKDKARLQAFLNMNVGKTNSFGIRLNMTTLLVVMILIQINLGDNNKYQEKIKKSMQIMGEKHSKTYTLISPENKLIIFTNLAKFARDNNLNPQSLKQVAMGRLKSNKGWTLS